MRRSFALYVRRKHGQKGWSPSASSSGAAPANGVTAQEALHIAYRPMPPAQTVEYEEDFGPNMMIHREFISKKGRSAMSFDLSPLAYSDVELNRAKQQLAGVMNRERRGVLVGAAGEEKDRVFFNADLDESSREVRSARYLFNEARMQFCDRFQGFFRDLHTRAAHAPPPPEEEHLFFSLMEACAIVYGCETAAARETYYRMFLQLDLESMRQDEQELQQRLEAARHLRDRFGGGGQTERETGETDAVAVDAATSVEALIEALPPLNLLGDDVDEEEEEETGRGVSTPPAAATSSRSQPAAPAQGRLPEEYPEEVAPLYEAYLAHASGQSPIASYDASSLGTSSVTDERRRWRDLMERLVAEDYHTLTPQDLEDARILNGQLHTVKFLDLKIGDTVREVMQLLQRDTGLGSSGDRDAPTNVSPNHPERRV